MNRRLLIKTFALSIIFIFIGASVSSAIYIDTKKTISNNESEEDCCCKDKLPQNNPNEPILICIGLMSIAVRYWLAAFKYNQSAKEVPEGSIRWLILKRIENMYMNIANIFVIIAKSLNCKWSENVDPRSNSVIDLRAIY
jgi:hypothetical protein